MRSQGPSVVVPPVAFGAARDRGRRHESRHQARLLDQEYSTGRMGPGFRFDADGHLVGDDPCPAADLPGHGARRIDGDGWRDRRHCRGDRLRHQDILRRALGLAWQAQMARGRRLRSRGLHQAGVSARANRRVAGRRALRRSDRQRHSRRAPRCAGGGPLAASSARRELWSAPIARHGWRLRRSPARYRADVVDGRQFHGRLLVRRHSRLPGAGADHFRRART